MKKILATITLSLVLFPSSVFAALIHADGFEHGGQYYNVSGGTFSMTATNPITGDISLRVNPTTTNTGYVSLTQLAANGDGGSGISAPFACVRFRPDTLPSANDEEFISGYNGGTFKGGVRVSSTGKIRLYDSTGAQIGSDSSTTVVAGSSYHVCSNIPNGTSATGSVVINDVQEISGTGDFGASNTTAHSVGKRNNRNGETVDFYYDDFHRETTSYVGNSTTIVKKLVPNANGSTMQWTAGTGTSDWDEVNFRGVPSGSAYVKSTAAGDVAMFDVESTADQSITGTVHGVFANTFARENTGGAGVVYLRISSGGTDADTNALGLGASLAMKLKAALTDPNTGSDWTLAALDEVEIGCVEDATSAVRHRCSATNISVLFTPAAGMPEGTGELKGSTTIKGIMNIK